ncbi:50S ribosomal protein L1 [Coprinopsis cinerea okayama7|uniref:50S ribosomal protein L1 n=1 Tax=Coprinopsis cinerea (strain Okayama-7 / 130 / ATCC MYA-4618 / FGSC 9003) TaxID=240176 RepID=D6RK71_COPC7|nr:mitochondrial 54S ribosomal protein MRPL1 [Coprinopsis cinerea okayama7\|eukprot:XP_002912198.1 mitochondrial 54S ribosomal protein MRPL1 [Coprinopsis cinerea okayama7\
MLGPVFRQCQRRVDALTWRQFSTTPAVQLRRDPKSQIRIPSKKALAAKIKRRQALAAKEDEKAEKLPLEDAINVLRAVEVASPNSIYELTVRTEVGNGLAVPKGRVNLPREAKKSKEEKIVVFAEGKIAEEARKAGADVVGGPELMESVRNSSFEWFRAVKLTFAICDIVQILQNRIRPTTVLCTPALIKTITPKLGRHLGPLGLMPSERRGTVTEDMAGYLQKLKGTSEWRADKAGTIRVPIAVMNFPVSDVVKNIRHFMISVKKATGNMRDESDRQRVKGTGPKPVVPIKKVILSSRQGPGIRIADI